MTRRWQRVMCAVSVCVAAQAVLGQEFAAPPVPANERVSTASFPITTDQGPVGKLLKKWHAEGTAAGHDRDLYDNRDRGHSVLALGSYPQLRQLYYSMKDREANRDWIGRTDVVPGGVVFGNSSTSAAAAGSGSNTRMLYATAGGIEGLHQQYRGNNLYIYPSHQDYLPGRCGIDGGWGDLLPANTPYLITSAGSSFSDQPFMHAVAQTLAAFRPEVKRRLVEEGMLMPTIQMIFRMCNKQVMNAEDYLSGKAHPAVFDGAQVDALKMVEMAHGLTLETLPPLAQLVVLEADQGLPGTDYFDPLPETLAATPGAVARVYRAAAGSRRVVVSAALSKDLNERKLTYRWVVLQGDPKLVQITPGEGGRTAEIRFLYHPRRAETPGGIGSSRVDVALFVHNGVHYSAPAFVTSFSLDTETRTYDTQGRVVEVGYDLPWPAVAVKDYVALFAALGQEKPQSTGVRLLCEAMGAERLAAIRTVGQEYTAAGARLTALQDELAKMEKLVGGAKQSGEGVQAALASARGVVSETAKTQDAMLDRIVPAAGMSARQFIGERLATLMNEPMLYVVHQREFGTPASALAEKIKWGENWGVLRKTADGYAAGTGEAGPRLTECERTMLQGINAAVLAGEVPGVVDDSRSNLVDFRLVMAKRWRDVFQYGDSGESLGWKRFTRDGAKYEFSPKGEVIVSRDELGRVAVTRTMKYQAGTAADPRVTMLPGNRYTTYSYRDASDRVGKLERVEHRD